MNTGSKRWVIMECQSSQGSGFKEHVSFSLFTCFYSYCMLQQTDIAMDSRRNESFGTLYRMANCFQSVNVALVSIHKAFYSLPTPSVTQ